MLSLEWNGAGNFSFFLFSREGSGSCFQLFGYSLEAESSWQSLNWKLICFFFLFFLSLFQRRLWELLSAFWVLPGS